MKISVVIPVYKNKELFLNNISHNIAFLKGCEIIVIDDASREGLGEIVRDKFPDVITYENEKNVGFAQTVNKGVDIATADYIFLLNSDVRLRDDSYKKGISYFADETIFGVSFAQKEKNGEVVGKNRIYFSRGFIRHEQVEDVKPGLNGWAEGGSSLIDKKKFNSLGGLDVLYNPFYWEDIDLSYRAYKKGWHVLFDPTILVEHHHESTIRKYFTEKQIKTIAYRNQFIFMWKNITQLSKLIEHKVYLCIELIKALLRGDKPFVAGLFQAIIRLPALLKVRRKQKKGDKLSDSQVVSLFKDHE